MDIPRTPTKRGRVGIPSLRRRAAVAYPPRQAILVLARSMAMSTKSTGRCRSAAICRNIVDVRESACAGDHGNALQQPQRRDRRNDDHAGSTDEAPQPHQGHHPHDLWLPPRQQPHRARHAPLRRTQHTPTTTKNLTHENSRSPSILQFHYKRSHHGIRTPTRVCVHDSSNEPYPPLDGRLQYRDAMR